MPYQKQQHTKHIPPNTPQNKRKLQNTQQQKLKTPSNTPKTIQPPGCLAVLAVSGGGAAGGEGAEHQAWLRLLGCWSHSGRLHAQGEDDGKDTQELQASRLFFAGFLVLKVLLKGIDGIFCRSKQLQLVLPSKVFRLMFISCLLSSVP